MLDEIHDTEAFVAANDDTIVVAFRGSSELTDWVTNLSILAREVPPTWGLDDAKDCEVHRVSCQLTCRVQQARYSL